MKKSKLIVVNVCIIAVVSGGLYFLARSVDKKNRTRVETVNKSYSYSKGLIVDFKSYKGHHLVVKYHVDGKTREFSGGWDINPRGLCEGDSISFRYSVKNPTYIITELEIGY